MISKIVVSVVVLLALGAGVAFAATQLASTDGTHVCVNQSNGLMRVSSTCRAGEDAMTIGGGNDVAVTPSGTVTVAVGATSDPITLPLTGLRITWSCDRQNAPVPPYSPDAAVARISVAAPTGTMDVITSQPKLGGLGLVGTIDGTAVTYSVYGTLNVGDVNFGEGTAIASANGATASLTYGVQVSEPGKTCKFVWQATEAPN